MKKTILITGATGAIGGATVHELAKGGHHIVMVGRNPQKLETLKQDLIKSTGNNSIDILTADLAHISSIKNVAKEFKQKYNRLDALINISAIYRANRELSKDGLEMMFATNHMGPFVLTNELLDVLKQTGDARIVTVAAPSTTKLNFDDLQGEKKYSSMYSFGGSKMMNLMTNYTLAKKLEGTKVTANTFHPGLVKSDLVSEMKGPLKAIINMMSTKPDKAAHALAELAISEKYNGVTGKFFDFKQKEKKSNAYSHDVNAQQKLWELSEQLANK
jgi:NAD(P)-dependent dehydrogenase (short-subunit alcohol dehydrogenase family)